MTSSVQSVEDVCNLALGVLGYPRRIGDIYEGTRASKLALDLYAQTRDEILRGAYWGFAKREVVLTLLKSAPAAGYSAGAPWSSAYPQLPWLYEYEYPGDCIRLLYITTSQLSFPNYDPQPTLFEVGNDNSLPTPAKVIFSNTANALMTYTGQVTDMTTWEPLFVLTLAEALAKKFSAALADGKAIMESAKMHGDEELDAAGLAQTQEEM